MSASLNRNGMYQRAKSSVDSMTDGHLAFFDIIEIFVRKQIPLSLQSQVAERGFDSRTFWVMSATGEPLRHSAINS